MSDLKLLVLSGGAAKGAYQAGAIKFLLGEQNICYDGYVGTSVGGLNASVLSMFPKGEEKAASSFLTSVWEDIKRSKDIYKSWLLGKLQFFLPRWTRLNRPSLYNNAPLRKRVRNLFDTDKTIKSGKLLRLVVVSLDTGDIKYFHESFHDLRAAVMATSSFPAAFPPDLGAKSIDAIITSPDPYPYKPLHEDPEGIEVAERVIDLMSDEISHNDVPGVNKVNQRIVEGDEEDPEKRYINLRVMRPVDVLTSDSLDFSPASIAKMMELGYEQAKEVFT
jgi:hypothetical protein